MAVAGLPCLLQTPAKIWVSQPELQFSDCAHTCRPYTHMNDIHYDTLTRMHRDRSETQLTFSYSKDSIHKNTPEIGNSLQHSSVHPYSHMPGSLYRDYYSLTRRCPHLSIAQILPLYSLHPFLDSCPTPQPLLDLGCYRTIIGGRSFVVLNNHWL